MKRFLEQIEELVRRWKMRRALMLGSLLILALSGCNSPDVDPSPNDDDKTSGLVLVVLDDANTRTAETGAILSDDQFWQKIRAEGHGYRFVDANNPSAGPFKTDAEKAGMPALLIYKAAKMKLLYAGKLPAETNRIDELVTKYGGKKARGPPVHVDSTGEVRRLGLLPPDAKAKARRQKLIGFGAFLETKGMKLIPAEQWREIDYPRFHKPEFVLNQQQTSGCVGFSAAAANMKIRALRGMKPERLSGAFVYSLINGGRDAGAMIDDSRLALAEYGVCLEEENPLPKIYWRQVSESAKQNALNRQLTLAYRVDSIQELATALQLGLIVQAGVQVDGNFERFDANGVSSARGGWANHSIHIYGMKNIGGKWVYRLGNTWGAWGPFKDGSCFIRGEGLVLGDAFVHADSEWLPDDLPTPKRDIQPLSVMEISGNTPGIPLDEHRRSTSRLVDHETQSVSVNENHGPVDISGVPSRGLVRIQGRRTVTPRGVDRLGTGRIAATSISTPQSSRPMQVSAILAL